MMTLAFFSTELLVILMISVLFTVLVVVIFGARLKAVINYMFKWKELEIKLNEQLEENNRIQAELNNFKDSLEKSNSEKQELIQKLADWEFRLKRLEEKGVQPSKEKANEKEDIVIEYYMNSENG
ncbi:MAG: hypothetical protein ACK5M7_18455 [Draconibacterium sp.]